MVMHVVYALYVRVYTRHEVQTYQVLSHTIRRSEHVTTGDVMYDNMVE